MYSSSISFGSARNSSSADRSAAAPGCRKVPLIGFIMTSPSATLTCRSGLAPTRIRVPVCTRNVQYAPRSSAQQPAQRGQRRVSGEPGSRWRQVRWMTKFAPSPRPISSASTVRTDPGVLLVGGVEAGADAVRTGRRQGGEHLGEPGPLPRLDAQVLQRGAVVDAGEAPLGDLPVRHQGQRLRPGRPVGQR